MNMNLIKSICGEFVPQGIVANNRAVSQQLVELSSSVWSGKGAVKGTTKDRYSRMAVSRPKAAPSQEQYQRKREEQT